MYAQGEPAFIAGAITSSCFKATFWQTPTSTRLLSPFSSEVRDTFSESLKSSHSEDVWSREQTCPHTAVRLDGRHHTGVPNERAFSHVEADK